MKKILVMTIAIAMICMLMPVVAFAADIHLFGGEVVVLNDLSSNDNVYVNPTANVTVQGDGADVIFFSNVGTVLNFNNIALTNAMYSPFIFDNPGANSIILNGSSNIRCVGSEPAIDLMENVHLDIAGDGTLFVSAPSSTYEIGASSGNNGTLSISGDATVFFERGSADSVTPTTTHGYFEYANVSEVPTRFSVPAGYVYPIGAYMKKEAPRFTAAVTNTSQTIAVGGTLSALLADDPNGKTDITSFTVVGGSLPTGITLNNNGTFTGTAQAGVYTATIEVADAGGLTSTTTLNVTVGAAPEPVDDSTPTVQRVENPETGQEFAANIHMLGIAIILLLSTSLSIKIMVAKYQNKAR